MIIGLVILWTLSLIIGVPIAVLIARAVLGIFKFILGTGIIALIVFILYHY